MGLEKVPPKRGRKHLLPAIIEVALVDAISSFIGLAYAEQKKIPTRKEVIGMMSSCLREGPTSLHNYEVLYKRLYHRFSTDVVIVSGPLSIEHQRAVYTTYNNLYTWFDTLKEFLISKDLQGNAVMMRMATAS